MGIQCDQFVFMMNEVLEDVGYSKANVASPKRDSN